MNLKITPSGNGRFGVYDYDDSGDLGAAGKLIAVTISMEDAELFVWAKGLKPGLLEDIDREYGQSVPGSGVQPDLSKGLMQPPRCMVCHMSPCVCGNVQPDHVLGPEANDDR